MDQEYKQPKTIEEFKENIRSWYNNNKYNDNDEKGFREMFDDAIKHVTPIPEGTDPAIIYDWRNKTIDNLCDFFKEWYDWTPDVSTGLEYIQKFSWINYENEAGLKFVTTGLGYLMTKHFVVLNGNWMDSDESKSLMKDWVKVLGDKMNDYDMPNEKSEDRGYKSFNEFFTRKLKEKRPISSEDDDSVVV